MTLDTPKVSPPKNDLTIYDAAADAWWREDTRWLRTLRKMGPARFRFFDRHAPNWAGLDVLDLGCGGGFMAEQLADRGARVIGLDPAAKAVASARLHAAETGREIRYDVGVGEAIPLSDASVDRVVCVDVLEHVADLDKTLDEVQRVLRPGGWFLFDTINKTWFARRVVIDVAERVVGLLPRGTHDPDLFIPPKRLRGLLESRGFECEKFQGFGPIGIDRRLDFVFGLTPVDWAMYLGAARKRAAG